VFTRPDLLLRDNLAEHLKRAGCHTAILGVESASREILKAYKKDYDLEQIQEAFKLCRRIGLRTVATFIIGLPEDSRETIQATIRFARRLDPDFVSYNVAVPRQSTPLRKEASERSLLVPEAEMDQSGATASMATQFLGTDEVVQMKKRAIRDFYLRPSYLFRRMISVRSSYELLAQIREGLALIGKNL
jgi:anaerobic magnesium-protoporphyrin IX monomethyl ester cyclase